MRNDECVSFLQWALPRLGLRWAGLRKVRRQVCRRLARRMRELGLEHVDDYRARLESTPEEWEALDALCRVTISRFHRDRRVFEVLEQDVLPVLAKAAVGEERGLRAWSAGCASGEEPYTLALVWELRVRPAFPLTAIEILATDVDDNVLDRARRGAYGQSSLRELPDEWRRRAFTRRGERFHVRPRFRSLVTFARHDARTRAPEGPFDLVLCRNLAFTYFEADVQECVARELTRALRRGGALVVGAHESLPENAPGFEPWNGTRNVYRRERAARASAPGRGAL